MDEGTRQHLAEERELAYTDTALEVADLLDRVQEKLASATYIGEDGEEHKEEAVLEFESQLRFLIENSELVLQGYHQQRVDRGEVY